jgi:hypothetical protein
MLPLVMMRTFPFSLASRAVLQPADAAPYDDVFILFHTG